jgi:hypothetical protein
VVAVITQLRAILPVFGGISGSTSTMCIFSPFPLI